MLQSLCVHIGERLRSSLRGRRRLISGQLLRRLAVPAQSDEQQQLQLSAAPVTDSAGAPSPTLSPEYRLLTAAATPDPPWPDAVASSVDWSRVLELARHHRLEALLHWHLDRAELTAPDFAQEKLHSQRE